MEKPKSFVMKQGGLVWNHTMNQAMLSWGFTHLECEHYIYYQHTNLGILLVAIHVDNFSTIRSTKAVITNFKSQLRTKWTISNLGKACFCLGIALKYDTHH